MAQIYCDQLCPGVTTTSQKSCGYRALYVSPYQSILDASAKLEALHKRIDETARLLALRSARSSGRSVR